MIENSHLAQSNIMKKKISSSLIELLNCFETPSEYLEEKQSLCLNIAKDINFKNFSDYVISASNLLTNIQKSASKKEKLFFKTIEHQLHFFYSFLTNESKEILENSDKDMEFHDVFQTKINELQENILDEDSLSNIKTKISNHVFSVNIELMKYKELKKEQIDSFNLKFEKMENQLKEIKVDYKKMVSSFSSKIEELNIEKETDLLTQVHNRIGYNRLINKFYSNYLQDMNNHKKSNLNIVMCDIDHFKKINDEHGHDAGDKILSLFAKLVKEELRETDHICRVGGEEFVIIMSGSYYSDSLKVIERIRKKIENKKIEYKDKNITITSSFGMSYFNGSDDVPIDVYKRADEALYSSKKNGRNRIYLNDPFEHNGIISFEKLVS